MVRVAQGNPTMLLPDGVSTFDRASADLATAISHARLALSWSENLPRDEQPPHWMWPFPDELDEWFSEVEAARKEKYKTGDSGDEDATMTENTFYDD